MNSVNKARRYEAIKDGLNSVPIPSVVMKQIGFGLCTLAEVDGYCHLIVSIDYF